MNDRMDSSYTNRTFLPDQPVQAPPVIIARRPTPVVARPKGTLWNPAVLLIIATIVNLLVMSL